MANEPVARDAKEIIIRDWNSDLWCDVIATAGGNALLVTVPPGVPMPVVINGSLTVQNVETIVPLGGGAGFTGASRDCETYPYFCARSYANVAGTLFVESSIDNAIWEIEFTQLCALATLYPLVFSTAGRYYRVRYLNGGAAQAVFRLSSERKPT